MTLIERVWLYLREQHFSCRPLDGYDAIVDALCAAWNQLTPERLRSLTNYPCLEQVRIRVGLYGSTNRDATSVGLDALQRIERQPITYGDHH